MTLTKDYTTVDEWRFRTLVAENMEDYDCDGWLNLVFGIREVKIPYRGFTPAVYNIYRSGYCAFLALALHELTGKPLAIFTIPGTRGKNTWEGHVAIQTGDDEYLDISGLTNAEVINDDYGYGEHFACENMELTVVDNWEDFKDIFHDSIHSDPWRLFMGELEELVTRDYAGLLARDYLR